MQHITVETTGNFMLRDRFSGAEITPGEAHTVHYTTFIQERIEAGQLTVIGDVPEAPPSVQETAGEEPAQESDTNDDGHNDETGEFVEGNQEAAKPPRRSGRRN